MNISVRDRRPHPPHLESRVVFLSSCLSFFSLLTLASFHPLNFYGPLHFTSKLLPRLGAQHIFSPPE
uniref:Ovule protein n=1 Tax=Caenorhabditis tropicalis TaxID=1561998 RepID=A0A1I7UMQ2_9PELO